MFVTFLFFALTIYNFQKNCCEVCDKICPKSNTEICYCINISVHNKNELKPIPLETTLTTINLTTTT